MNWDDLRYVLALARAGSLARAARELGVDHTTVGRRIEALEEALDVGLFARTTTGYVLTQEAEGILPGMREIEDAILSLQRGIGGRDTCIRGTVRITTGESFAARFIGPRLGAFAARHPEINLEIVTGPQTFDLARREADVALRFYRSTQEHLVVRKVAELGFAAYASEAYLARRGTPKSAAALRDHDLLGVDDTPRPLEDAWFDRVAQGRFVLRTNSTALLLTAARAGVGIALLPCFLGDVDPELRRLPISDAPVRAIWLTVHRDLRNATRVRAVMEFLAELLRAEAALLRGAPTKRSRAATRKRARA